MYQNAGYAEQAGVPGVSVDAAMQQPAPYQADAAQAYDYSQQAAYQQPQGADAAVSGYNSYPTDVSAAASGYALQPSYTPLSTQAYTGDNRSFSKTTVYVGGLPMAVPADGGDGQPRPQFDEAALHNFFFSSCGPVKSIRPQPGRNYCFIEFETPEAAAAAISLNGCQATLNPAEPTNISRLIVKPAHERGAKPPPAYAPAPAPTAPAPPLYPPPVDAAAAAGYDALAYNGNGYWQQPQQPQQPPAPPRVASPEPVAVRYTEAEMKRVKEVLKVSSEQDEFQLAVRRVGRWLEGGECTKRTVDHFHSCLQTIAGRARAFRQLRDDRQAQWVAEQQQLAQSLVGQCEAMAAAMEAGNHQKVRDIMSRTQRKNLDNWIATVNDICRSFQQLSSGQVKAQEPASGAPAPPPLTAELSEVKSEGPAAKRKREEGEAEGEGTGRVAELEATLSTRDGMIRSLTARVTALEAELAARQPASPAAAEGAGAGAASTSGRTPLNNCILSALSVYLMAHPQGAPLSDLALYVHRVASPAGVTTSGPAPPATMSKVSAVLTSTPGVFRRVDTGLGEPLWSVSALQSLPQLLSQAQ